MKKGIALALAIICIILTAVTACADMYPTTMVVVDVNYDTDTVTCMDFNGNLWEFTECEDWLVGDYATMIMDDMNTDLIFDDEIVSIRYTGWLNGSFGYGDHVFTDYND